MIGLSVSGPNQDEIIREALKIYVSSDDGDENNREQSQSGIRLFDSVQCTYNVLEQRPGTALLEAHEAGMDIIIKEGLANGRALADPTLLEVSRETGCSLDALALGAILVQPFRPRVLSGAVTAAQLRSNLGALYADAEGHLGAVERLTSTEEGEATLRRLMKGCRAESEAYWRDRTELKWN